MPIPMNKHPNIFIHTLSMIQNTVLETVFFLVFPPRIISL